MAAGSFAFSTVGPETFGDFIATHLNPALAFLLNPPTLVDTTNYTVLAGDGDLVVGSALSTACGLTLPASSLNSGRPLRVKTVGPAVNSTAANVYPQASTVLGTAILSSAAGKYADLKADGHGNWTIMASN